MTAEAAEARGVPFHAAAAAVLYDRYAHGVDCTWHGPARDALLVNDHGEQPDLGCLRCPSCNGPARALPEEAFWAEAAKLDRTVIGYEAMLRWSARKCFPDFATLEDAYRQATTE